MSLSKGIYSREHLSRSSDRLLNFPDTRAMVGALAQLLSVKQEEKNTLYKPFVDINMSVGSSKDKLNRRTKEKLGPVTRYEKVTEQAR